jgi:hypothetical protein
LSRKKLVVVVVDIAVVVVVESAYSIDYNRLKRK